MDWRSIWCAGAHRVLAMAVYGISMAKRVDEILKNKMALYWTIGCCVMSFVGAGFLGLTHTLPQVNLYTHGTLVTAMHGHMAFLGCICDVSFINYHF